MVGRERYNRSKAIKEQTMKRLIKLYVIVPVTIVACIVTMTITAHAGMITKHGAYIKPINSSQSIIYINGQCACCQKRTIVNHFSYRLKQGQQIEVTFQTKGKQIIDAWISDIK